ncbi:hypothetical protein Bca52824_039279 [Brassica carinata]|uniref:Uncharacterized protein n=1 Tax=Brassica carinata TaxID=52824 RepID=A0A8X7RQU3_BRACI|nr:hypothetical protein Bca52824_039279 [Brassica carinata]
MVKEWMCGSFGQSEQRWGLSDGGAAVLLPLVLVVSGGVLLGRSNFLLGAYHELLSFPSRLGLLRVLRSGGVCEEASCRSCQPQQIFSVAARVVSARIGG